MIERRRVSFRRSQRSYLTSELRWPDVGLRILHRRQRCLQMPFRQSMHSSVTLHSLRGRFQGALRGEWDFPAWKRGRILLVLKRVRGQNEQVAEG